MCRRDHEEVSSSGAWCKNLERTIHQKSFEGQCHSAGRIGGSKDKKLNQHVAWTWPEPSEELSPNRKYCQQLNSRGSLIQAQCFLSWPVQTGETSCALPQSEKISAEGWQWQLWSEPAAAQIEADSRHGGLNHLFKNLETARTVRVSRLEESLNIWG